MDHKTTTNKCESQLKAVDRVPRNRRLLAFLIVKRSRVSKLNTIEVTVDLKLCCPRTDYGLVLVII